MARKISLLEKIFVPGALFVSKLREERPIEGVEALNYTAELMSSAALDFIKAGVYVALVYGLSQ